MPEKIYVDNMELNKFYFTPWAVTAKRQGKTYTVYIAKKIRKVLQKNTDDERSLFHLQDSSGTKYNIVATKEFYKTEQECLTVIKSFEKTT